MIGWSCLWLLIRIIWLVFVVMIGVRVFGLVYIFVLLMISWNIFLFVVFKNFGFNVVVVV